MKEVFRAVLRTLRMNWLSLLFFDFIYRFSLLSVLIGGVSFLMNLAMDVMGYSYVTLGNLGDFLLNPLVILILALAILVLLILTLVELSALFYCYDYSRHGMRISPLSMLILGLDRTIRIIKRGKLRNLLWTLFLIPFLYHPVLTVLLYRYGIWGQMLATIFSGSSYIPAALGILLFVLLSGIFSLYMIPCIIIEEMTYKDTLVLVKSYFRKYLWRGGKYLIFWNALLSVFQMVLYVLLVLIMGGLLHFQPGEQEYIYVQALSYHNWILMGIMTLAAFICLLLNSALIFQLYVRVCTREKIGKKVRKGFEHPVAFIYKKKRNWVRAIVGGFIIVEVILSVIYIRDSEGIAGSPFETVNITAHRGNSIDLPENTVPAVESAIEQMADYAEIDVQQTADGVIVLLHDMTLLRTCGIPDSVYDMDYTDLQQLDAGSYMGEDFIGTQIPTLAEILELCKGKINLNIEVKSHPKYKDSLIPNVVSLIEYYNMENQCVISSMNYNYLGMVKAQNSNIQTGYIVRNLYGSVTKMEDADFVCVKHTGVSAPLVERVHEAGKEVWCWTVNSPSEVKKMCSLEVDNIITDNPAMVRSLIAQDTFSLNLMDLFEMLIFTE